MLDLNDIALFVQVARSGSFAEAARRLGVPPNTVSRRIQQLEEQLGTRLLQRSTRKLTLTSAGEGFHERCANSVDGLVDAGQELMTDNQEASGLVRVAAPADFFDVFLMEWVAEFLRANPKVRLEFVLSDAKADLIGERIDVAFRGGILQDSGYVGRKVLPDGNDGLVASPGYLAARGVPLKLQDLADHDCVTFAHPSGYANWRLAGPDGVFEEVRVISRIAANTAQSIRKAAVADMGITLIPYALTRLDLQAGLLLPVLPQYKSSGQGFNVLYPSRRQLPKAVSTFIDLVVEKLNSIKISPAVVQSGRAR